MMLYEPMGQPVVDLWSHELLSWCRDPSRPAARPSGLTLPPTVAQEDDDRVRRLWSSSIPEPSRPASPPTLGDDYDGEVFDFGHNLSEDDDYSGGTSNVRPPENQRSSPSLPSPAQLVPLPAQAAVRPQVMLLGADQGIRPEPEPTAAAMISGGKNVRNTEPRYVLFF